MMQHCSARHFETFYFAEKTDVPHQIFKLSTAVTNLGQNHQNLISLLLCP